MSLRTRRGLALGFSLMLVVAACTGTTPTTGPGTSAPGTTAPGTTAPGTTAPGTTAPGTTAPGTDAPGTDAPGTDAPGTDGPGGGLAADQTLRLSLGATDPPTLDPNAAEDTQSISVLTALHRGLLYWSPDDLSVVPSLAEALPEVTDEGRTLTFRIREGAQYSNGDPIVAADLEYGWKRLVDPRLVNPYRYVMCYVAGVPNLIEDCGGDTVVDATDDAAVEAALGEMGISAPDERTFIVNLESPATFFTSVVAMWIAVPLQQAWIEAGDPFSAANYVSSGPYVLETYTNQREIILQPNENWYGEQKPTVTVQLNIGGDPDAAQASYEAGDLDAVVVPATQLRRVQDDPQFADQIQTSAQLGITYYGFATCQEPADACPPNNTTADGRSPASNKNFRIALTQAVNKEQFLEVTFAGTGQVAHSMVMPGLAAHDPDYNPYPFDLDAANAAMTLALEELGVQDGPDTAPEGEEETVTAADLGTITIGYNSNAGHLPRVAFLAEAWRTGLGFEEAQFNFVGVDFSTFLQQRTQGTYDVSRNGWGADFPHPHNQLSDLFRCNGGNNDEQWCDPEFDRLVDEAAATSDLAQQEQLYIQAQRLMLDDAPIIPLRFGETTYLVQPWVSGLQATSADHQNIGDQFYESIQILDTRP